MRPGKPWWTSCRGITLAEFLVSSLIFLIVLTAVLTLMPFSAFATAHSRAKVQAELVARSVLDEYRARPFERLTIESPISLPPTRVENGRTFTPRVQVKAVAGYDPTKVLEVEVEIRWEEPRGRKNLKRSLVLSNVSGL